MIKILPLNKPTQVEKNLICFHHVGGNATAFKPLAKFLEEHQIKVWGVQLPGRVPKLAHEATIDSTILVNEIFKAIKNGMREGLYPRPDDMNLHQYPLFFFGHSLGGILAYEVAKRMKKELDLVVVQCDRNKQLDKLILSAVRNPPSLTESNCGGKDVMHHLQPEKELTAYLLDIGGPNASLLILETMLPVIMNDYKIFETYDTSNFHSGVMVDCPVTAFSANQDSSVSMEEIVPWSKHCPSGSFEMVCTDGSHNYFQENQAAFHEHMLRICKL